MSFQIEPSLIDIAGQLVEAYERVTNASDDKLVALGLSPENRPLANIAIAPVPEYIVLYADDIEANTPKYWEVAELGQTIRLDNLYIDSPNQDPVTITLFLEGTPVFVITLQRNQTPYQFPAFPITSDCIIKIQSPSAITRVFMVCIPCVITQSYEGVNSVTILSPDPPQ